MPWPGEYLQMRAPAGATGPSFLGATGLPSAHEPGEAAVIGASLCCYWASDSTWELQGSSDRHEPEKPMRWVLLRDGQGPDRKREEPERYDALRSLVAHWPHHPGRYGRLEVGRDPQESQALERALRRGGYWAPDDGPTPPEVKP